MNPKIVKHPRGTPLRNETLGQTIYDDIRDRLQRGKLGAKGRLLDYEIADEYGCTRTPARQALLRLVSEGYLQGTTRGFTLPTFSAEDIREIFEIRRLLEPHAASSVTALLTEHQHEELRKAYASAAEAIVRNDSLMLAQANIAFRSVWLGSLGNERLKDTIRRFADHVQLIRTTTLSNPSTQHIVLEGLQRLMNGFLARDEILVHGAMKEFVQQAEQHYMLLAQATKASKAS